MQVTATQWSLLGDAGQQRLRKRLVDFLEQHVGPPEPGTSMRTSGEVADAALQFADTAGAVTEAQVARIAILLVAVNRMQLPPERVAGLRAVLTQAGKTADERIAAAAAFIGIET